MSESSISPLRRHTAPTGGQLALRGEGRLTVALRKPFGIGFHIGGATDEPLVVDVKGVAAKAAGGCDAIVASAAARMSLAKYFISG